MGDAADDGGAERSAATAEEASGVAPDVVARLQSEPPLRDYLVQKYEAEAKRNWDLFYKRNTTNFFKDRHWLAREFPEIAAAAAAPAEGAAAAAEGAGGAADAAPHRTLLEIGCGVGNAVFPMLQDNPGLAVWCCDLSPRAVEFVRGHEEYDEARCHAFQCDVVADALAPSVPEGGVDCTTMLFVLSAVSPAQFDAVARNVRGAVKDGGMVFFRDYGRYDHAQQRFKPGHKLTDNFYVRQDGTRAYYFSTDELKACFEAAGFETVECRYVAKETSNRRMGVCVPRVFVQAKFRAVAPAP